MLQLSTRCCRMSLNKTASKELQGLDVWGSSRRFLFGVRATATRTFCSQDRPTAHSPALFSVSATTGNRFLSTAASTVNSSPSVTLGSEEGSKQGQRRNLESVQKRSRNESISTAWSHWYKKLLEFKLLHGHCFVPFHGYDKALYMWAELQRKDFGLYVKGQETRMMPEKIFLLSEIGFVFASSSERLWFRQYANLVEYKEKYGTCTVSQKRDSLGTWVAQQRFKYWRNTLRQDYVKLLQALDFEFRGNEALWMKKYRKLEEFHRQHRHCMVPDKYEPDLELSAWVRNQRSHYKKFTKGVPPYSNYMTKKRIEMLEKLGFVWSAQDVRWKERFKALKNTLKTQTWNQLFKERHPLVCWVARQRKFLEKWLVNEKSTMTAQREQLLDSLKIPWKGTLRQQ